MQSTEGAYIVMEGQNVNICHVGVNTLHKKGAKKGEVGSR